MASSITLPQTQIATVVEKLGNFNEIFKYTESYKLPLKSVADLKEDQVLVKLVAAAVNPVDTYLAAGRMKPTETEFPFPLGKDGAGVVAAVGSKVTKFKVGDEVLGFLGSRNGTFAQYVVYVEAELTHKPKELSFEEAASLPVAAVTIIQVFDAVIGGVKHGSTVLIHGGSGSTGGVAVLLAKHLYNLKVYTTTSTRNVEYVKSLGADRVIDYTKEKYEEVIAAEEPSKTVSIVIDTVGQAGIAETSKGILAEDGTYLTIADFRAPPFSNFKTIMAKSRGDDLARVVKVWAEQGLSGKIKLHPTPLKDLAVAFEGVASKRTVGKFVIQIPQ